jgi:hypothetical protein
VEDNFLGKIEYAVRVAPAPNTEPERSGKIARKLGQGLPKMVTLYSDGQNLRIQQEGVEEKSYDYHDGMLVQELGQKVYELDAEGQEALQLRAVTLRMQKYGLPFQRMKATGERKTIQGYACSSYETDFSEGEDEGGFHLTAWFAPGLRIRGLGTANSYGHGQFDNFMLWMMQSIGALPLALAAEVKRNPEEPTLAVIHLEATSVSKAAPSERWFKLPAGYSVDQQFPDGTEEEASGRHGEAKPKPSGPNPNEEPANEPADDPAEEPASQPPKR